MTEKTKEQNDDQELNEENSRGNGVVSNISENNIPDIHIRGQSPACVVIDECGYF